MKIVRESPNGKFYRAVNEIEAEDGTKDRWNVIGKYRVTFKEDKFGKKFKVPNNAEIYYKNDELNDLLSIFKDK